MKLTTLVITLVSALLLAPAGTAQTAIYLGGGPSIYAPGSTAGNLTLGICTQDGGTCSLTSVEARGSARDLASLVYSTQTGIRRVIASVQTSAVKVDLFALGQAGANVSGGAVAAAFTGGGGLSFHPAKYPNWSLSLAARAVYSPVNPGWQPWGGLLIGYTFRPAVKP